MSTRRVSAGDKWRYVCPECESTRWAKRQQWYYCEACCERFDGLLDKKLGVVV